ncbi:lipopolysaccharide biosynthesis protein [Roseisalinus antarcticus]|uniref:Polysaccharide biosynthesis protein n=1 Tax=Roseisalinus antarcticus TaxID=254357 RepID=A0A1Y5TI82_9RHOB|nr:oligosaccharide flippase family protein [Roseisalinus antarcticus]SLN64285.1 Polysaccharide biosynthesis protein [Roseisalinus antarcticus]
MSADVPGMPTVKERSLRRNVGFAVSGRAVFALTQFGIIAVLTRLGTPEDVGALALASALVTPLFFLTSMGMREVHTVDDLDRFTRADYVALRMLAGLLAVLMTLAILATFYTHAGWLVHGSAIAFAMVKYFGAQMSLNHGIFQRAERMDYVALSNLGRGGLGLGVFAAAFWLTENLPVALAFESLAWLSTYLFLDRPLLRRLGAAQPFSELRNVHLSTILALAWWILPLGMALFMLRAAMSVPPILLERYVDFATVGIFGAIAYLHSALSMISNTLGSVTAPRLRRYWRKADRRAFVRLSLGMTLFAAGLGVVAVGIAVFAGEQVLRVLYGPGYDRADIFSIVMLASGISILGSPLVASVNAGQAFRRRLLTNVLAFVVVCALSLLLIPRIGALGAAWAMVGLTVTQTGLNALLYLSVLRSFPTTPQAETS